MEGEDKGNMIMMVNGKDMIIIVIITDLISLIQHFEIAEEMMHRHS